MNTNPLRKVLENKAGTMMIAHKKKDGSIQWKKHKFSDPGAAMRYLNDLKRKRQLYDSQPFRPDK